MAVLGLLSLCLTVQSQQWRAALNHAGLRGGRLDVRPFWLWIPAEMLAVALI